LQQVLEFRLKWGRQLVIHADNARLYTVRKSITFCESNSIKIAPHSPYSLDLVLSDFFFLVMLNIFWRKLPLVRKKKFFLKLETFRGEFHRIPCWRHFITGWRDWVGPPHVIVITSPELSFGCFNFLKSCSEIEMIYCRWKSYINCYF
jgi:hypothetical protein